MYIHYTCTVHNNDMLASLLVHPDTIHHSNNNWCLSQPWSVFFWSGSKHIYTYLDQNVMCMVQRNFGPIQTTLLFIMFAGTSVDSLKKLSMFVSNEGTIGHFSEHLQSGD